MSITQTVVIMAKQQHLEILKLIHAGIGQCWHWETMNFHKEIQRINKNYSGSDLLLWKIINAEKLKALCKSYDY